MRYKTLITIGLILVSPLMALAYAQPTTGDVYCAAGFGHSSANGTYTYEKTHADGGQSDFVFSNGSSELGFYEYPSNTHASVVITYFSDFPGHNSYTSSSGVFGTWSVGDGDSPAGTVVNLACVAPPSGVTLSTTTGNFTYGSTTAQLIGTTGIGLSIIIVILFLHLIAYVHATLFDKNKIRPKST